MSVRRTFSDERGPGTFHSLGVLPKSVRDTCPRRSPVFHIHRDDDDEHSSLDEHPTPPSTVHFPNSESSSPQSLTSSSSTTSPCSQLARGASAPILLANGKPLKPSLKSYSSSPAVLIPPQMHLRARSEPSTPKNVHFPEKDYLATVRVYNRSARPAALSNPANGNGDETETEGEDTPPKRFPFSVSPSAYTYEIDPTGSSPVPSNPSPRANLILESLNLPSSSFSSAVSVKPFLTGSLLVRNLAFEKHVAVRFTLDDWQTVSEVGAHYADSISDLPSKICPSPPPADARGRGWDRFKFTIRLEDYVPSLSTRTLWLVAHYRVRSTYPEPGSSHYGPGGEWWDNNDGGNYRVGFRPATTAPTSIRSKPRRETVSAPISSYRLPQPPIACNEHALGLMIPSVSMKAERRWTPLRAGKLDLCNYAPPSVRPLPSISSPCASSSEVLSSSSTLPPSLTQRSSSDEESTSPASSTLSTPSVSPTIVPRVIIGGQPATSTHEENTAHSKLGYIANWDWSAPSKGQPPSWPHVDHVPSLEPTAIPRDLSPPGGIALSEGDSLYDAFVTQWCFARGPSSHPACDGGGIMT